MKCWLFSNSCKIWAQKHCIAGEDSQWRWQPASGLMSLLATFHGQNIGSWNLQSPRQKNPLQLPSSLTVELTMTVSRLWSNWWRIMLALTRMVLVFETLMVVEVYIPRDHWQLIFRRFSPDVLFDLDLTTLGFRCFWGFYKIRSRNLMWVLWGQVLTKWRHYKNTSSALPLKIPMLKTMSQRSSSSPLLQVSLTTSATSRSVLISCLYIIAIEDGWLDTNLFQLPTPAFDKVIV